LIIPNNHIKAIGKNRNTRKGVACSDGFDSPAKLQPLLSHVIIGFVYFEDFFEFQNWYRLAGFDSICFNLITNHFIGNALTNHNHPLSQCKAAAISDRE
jgi:hypothetical protein